MNWKIWAAFALLLFFSFGCTTLFFGTSSKTGFLNTWGFGALVPVALATVVSLLAIAYMAGTLIGDEKLKAFARKEIAQAIYSVMILVVALALVDTLDQALKAMSLGGGDLVTTPAWNTYVTRYACCDSPLPGFCLGPVKTRPCHIELATDYLQFLYETSRMNAIASLMNYWFFAFLANMSVGVSLLVFVVQAGLSITPFAGLSAAADYFSLIFDLAVKTMMLIRAQQVFLDFINYPLFSICLAMGLVLRILYFTRKLGGLLIALVLSFYIVFPMFYVVSYAILWGFFDYSTATTPMPFGSNYDQLNYVPPFSDASSTTPVEIGGSNESKNVFDPAKKIAIDICNSTAPTNPPAVRNKAIADRAISQQIRENFQSRWDQVSGTNWYSQVYELLDVGTGGGFDRNGPIGALAAVMVFSLVIPFLALMTTLATIKVISPIMGGDVEISVLSRII